MKRREMCRPPCSCSRQSVRSRAVKWVVALLLVSTLHLGANGNPEDTINDDSPKNGIVPTTFLVPGDMNGDATFNVVDPITLMNFLFDAEPLNACLMGKAGELNHTGLTLADWNGDRAINISDPISGFNFLFAGGAPHFLGMECVELESECVGTCN